MKVSKNSKYSVAKHQNTGKGKWFFGKKSHNAKKTEKGDPLVCASTVCYAEKEEKPFRLNSLCQLIQFGP